MAPTEDSDIPETGAVFTFGKSKFADNLPNKFWVKNDRVLQVACGDEHTALIAESGRIFMFGPNDWGQLGLGQDNKGVNKPSCVKTLKHEKAKLVACGRSHTLVSTESGHLYSFGSNSEGQLGIKKISDAFKPKCIETLEPTEFKMLAAGSDSSVALTEDGQVFVWGSNQDGLLGLGKNVENSHEPEILLLDRPVVCVACGYYHTAFVTDDGKLYTMGESEGGKLGLPDADGNVTEPQEVTSIPYPVRWVACGSSHTVALTELGDCYVFGEGGSGQLGLGTDILSTATPILLRLPFKVARVFCGQAFTALISEKGQLYTFGDGRHGKLAHDNDQFSNQYRPFHCKRFSHFIVDMVACGGCHMIVTANLKMQNGDLASDGEVNEMKSLEEKSMSDSIISAEDGSPSLTRSLSARERRRHEVQKSFSTLTKTLPPLISNRRATTLSATLPAQRTSHSKMNGELHSKTFLPGLGALQNGKASAEDSADESEEETNEGNTKKALSQSLPIASPRRKPSKLQEPETIQKPPISPRRRLPHLGQLPIIQAQKHIEDGSEGDDEEEEEDSDGGKKMVGGEPENEGSEKKEEDEEEDNEISELATQLQSRIDEDDIEEDIDTISSLKEAQASHLVDESDNEKDEQQEEPTEEDSDEKKMNARELAAIAQNPVPVPRKKTDKQEDEDESENEVDEEEEEKKEEEDRKDSKAGKRDKTLQKKKHDKEEKKKKKEEEDDEEEETDEEKEDKNERKKQDVKKKNKNEEDNDESEDEGKRKKNKAKKNNKEKVTEKEKKKKKARSPAEEGKEDDEGDSEEDASKDSAKGKKKNPEKEKKKDKGDKEGKKKKKKEQKGEEEEEEDNSKGGDKKKDKKGGDKKKTKATTKDKVKDEDREKDKEKGKDKNENQNNEKAAPPPKKSRTCTIL